MSPTRGARARSGTVPPDPTVRRGVLPKKLVVQSEDVLVDARGYIYLTDKNHGLYVLRCQGLDETRGRLSLPAPGRPRSMVR